MYRPGGRLATGLDTGYVRFMCTVVILRRPDHPWPLLLAANRDEMRERPWQPPARHWDEAPHVIAGQDTLAGGTWLGLNDDRLVACVLNRRGSLGPAPGKRSRGELPIEALSHAEAGEAANALSHLDMRAYRAFNMIVADARDAYWVAGEEDTQRIRVAPIPEGLSMLTAGELNGEDSPRVRRYRPLFEAAEPPDPDAGTWGHWQALLAAREADDGAGPGGAMNIVRDDGFGTVSASLLALPSVERPGVPPRWLFCPGPPDRADWEEVVAAAAA